MLKRRFALYIAALIWAVVIFSSSGCTEQSDVVRGTFLSSLTRLSNFKGGDVAAAEAEIFDFLQQLEGTVSINIETSEISKLNRAAAMQRVSIGRYSYELLTSALEVYIQSEGAFNPFLPQLSRLWGFDGDMIIGGGAVSLPDSAAISEVLQYCNPQPEAALIFEGEDIVYKTDSRLEVDLGAIAKGYAALESRKIAQKHGITSGTINIAGNIFVIGENPARPSGKYVIGVTNPRPFAVPDKPSEHFARIEITETSVSVSGDYERYYLGEDGARYCHILDSSTGYPVNNGVMSVVVIMQRGGLADAYSTAAMVLGAEKGLEFLNNMGVAGIIITDDFKYYISGEVSLSEVYAAYSAADIDSR